MLSNSSVTELEQSLYGSNVSVLERANVLDKYEIKDETGESIITTYHVMEGINLIYYDVHMESIAMDLEPPKGFFEINHCKEGRIECPSDEGEFVYMSRGDFSVNKKSGKYRESYFPMKHYYGITICIEIEKAQRSINKIFVDNDIDLMSILFNLCNDSDFWVTRANESIEHIFAELYSVPEKIKMNYYKIKVLEVLLFLSTIDKKEEVVKEYFAKKHVDKVKEIQRIITTNIQRKYTLEELAKSQNISLTTMKRCFKGVYGSSIYSYIKTYRIEEAAKLLINTNENILDIANKVGYENGSKFAAVFKDIIGISPSEFRKNKTICPNGFI